jgi:hypothetical protein
MDDGMATDCTAAVAATADATMAALRLNSPIGKCCHPFSRHARRAGKRIEI